MRVAFALGFAYRGGDAAARVPDLGASCNSWISTWGGFDRGFDGFEDLRPWSRLTGPWQGVVRRVRRALGRLDQVRNEFPDLQLPEPPPAS